MIDTFIAIALANILLQLASIYYGYRMIGKSKDKVWVTVWSIFILMMLGIMLRRTYSFVIFTSSHTSFLAPALYYKILFEYMFQLSLSILFIAFARMFYSLKIEITKKEIK
jgi:hypothetical protein